MHTYRFKGARAVWVCSRWGWDRWDRIGWMISRGRSLFGSRVTFRTIWLCSCEKMFVWSRTMLLFNCHADRFESWNYGEGKKRKARTKQNRKNMLRWCEVQKENEKMKRAKKLLVLVWSQHVASSLQFFLDAILRRSPLNTKPPHLFWKINIGMHNRHISCERIVARKRLLLRAKMAACLLLETPGGGSGAGYLVIWWIRSKAFCFLVEVFEMLRW